MGMELDPILTSVNGDPDVLAFQADIGFSRDAKALTQDDEEYAQYADKLEEGDLLIAGWGANFEVDRQDEAFSDGAFGKAIKDFLEGEATLAYHHKHDVALGRVLDAYPVEGKGVRVIARVDSQPESSPHRYLYEQVRKGTLNALSVGGIFRRIMTPQGPRIHDLDITEWSITPVPVGRGANFSVVAGKALEGMEPEEPVLEDGKALFNGVEVRQSDVDHLTWTMEELSRQLGEIAKRGKPVQASDTGSTS